MNNLLLKYSPSFILDMACTVRGYRLDRQRYTKLTQWYYDFYEQTAKWDQQQLVEFQNKTLRETFDYAIENIEYYKRLYSAAGVGKGAVQCVNDLKQLPCLDKDAVRAAGAELVSREYDPDSLAKTRTGGSTGKPMLIYVSPESFAAQYGFHWQRWRPGVKRGDRYACFQGQRLVCPSRDRPPFWRNNYVANQRLYSVFHLTEKNLQYYFENLSRFRPVFIQGYPSAMYLLADYMERHGLEFECGPRAAYSMSEVVEPIHKQTIERVWRCHLWDQYGLGERVASLTLCEHDHYHYDMDYSVIEFDPIEDHEDHTVAEIVGTAFINKAWPLIRYRTGDMVRILKNVQCPCGRPGPVIGGVVGRTGDILVTPEGRKIINVTTAVKDMPGLIEMQVVQDVADHLTIRVAATGEDFQEAALLERLRQLFGPTMRMDVSYVDRIARTSGGKYKVMVSQIG